MTIPRWIKEATGRYPVQGAVEDCCGCIGTFQQKPGQRYMLRQFIHDEYICYVVGKFETVADAFNAGKTVRRVEWKPNVSGVVKLPNTRFVTLLLPNGTSKSWQPYAEDFAADDWYVV